eukprot:gene9137-9305_t
MQELKRLSGFNTEPPADLLLGKWVKGVPWDILETSTEYKPDRDHSLSPQARRTGPVNSSLSEAGQETFRAGGHLLPKDILQSICLDDSTPTSAFANTSAPKPATGNLPAQIHQRPLNCSGSLPSAADAAAAGPYNLSSIELSLEHKLSLDAYNTGTDDDMIPAVRPGRYTAESAPGSSPTKPRNQESLTYTSPRKPRKTGILPPPPGLDHADPTFIKEMVQLLSSDDLSAVLKAATKLCRLASDSNQDAACMVELGAVPCLLKLLSNNNAACLQMAVEALQALCACKISNSSQVLEAATAAAPRLVRLLGSRLSAVQLAATHVMMHLTEKQSSDRQQRLVDAGAVPMLLRVLQSGSADSQGLAVQALHALAAANVDFSAAISTAGAAPMLVPLLISQTSELQMPALQCFTLLAQGTTRAKSPGRVGAQAADCLQLLCTGCCEHAWACVAAGAVDQLVLMLKRFGCQSNAARCIWALAATHALVKETFIRTGVIPLLVGLLSRDNDPEHIPSQEAVVLADALPALVAMLRECPPANVQRNLVQALTQTLTGYLVSPEALRDRTSISSLITLLTCSIMEVKKGAMAALQQIVLKGDLAFVCDQLCTARGIPLVVRMLQCHECPQVQLAAADIVRALAAHSHQVSAYMNDECQAKHHLKALHTSPVVAVQEAAITATQALAKARRHGAAPRWQVPGDTAHMFS